MIHNYPEHFSGIYTVRFEIVSTKNFEQYGTEWFNTN